jgi:magnesium transporter
MGDNAATQTKAVIVRGIQLGELTWERGLAVVAKEALVGAANGAALGLAAAVVVGIWMRSLWLAVALGLALAVTTFVACALGALVPLWLKRYRVDPAIVSSVFVVTITVLVGLFVFLLLGATMVR